MTALRTAFRCFNDPEAQGSTYRGVEDLIWKIFSIGGMLVNPWLVSGQVGWSIQFVLRLEPDA
jgi:hypothetical protein